MTLLQTKADENLTQNLTFSVAILTLFGWGKAGIFLEENWLGCGVGLFRRRKTKSDAFSAENLTKIWHKT